MRIAVDFDGVLHNPLDRSPGFKLGHPIEGAVESMRRLKEHGDIIVIHSVWANTDARQKAIADWCNFFGIRYDFITSVKPLCDIYIDNLGYRFENWKDTLEFVTEQRRESQSQSEA